MIEVQSVDCIVVKMQLVRHFCIAVDFDTLEDDTVTLRDRDTMEQQRVHINELENIIREKVDMKQLFV